MTASDRSGDRGFMMVALLIAMAVAAIWMTAALPSWRQQAQRSREEDLIFRGEQYARAIMLYQDKNRGASPPDIDTLVSQHFLRKKWKDPITNCEFVPVGPGVVAAPCNTIKPPVPTPGTSPTASAPISAGTQQMQSGITGVRSPSQATSIKIYQQQQQYNLWQFDASLIRAQIAQRLGGRAGGPGARPGDGRQGTGGRQGPGGRQGGEAGRVGVPGRGVGPIGPGGRGGLPPPPPPPRPGGRGGGGLF